MANQQGQNHNGGQDFWLFGYGSLIWRPDVAYVEKVPAIVHGWVRRFWQGSHDHRGTQSAPGRVVTLVPETAGVCQGMAYRISAADAAQVLGNLDYREKNGYQRLELPATVPNGAEISTLTYIGTADNFAYLGDAPAALISAQIARSSGPSGHNRDYLFQLADALRQLGANDPHVFDLERQVRKLTDHPG